MTHMTYLIDMWFRMGGENYGEHVRDWIVYVSVETIRRDRALRGDS